MSPGPSTPRVSLLMPNRDNAALLDHVLERLAQNTTYPDFELLVVDDGSTDQSLDILHRWRDSGRFAEMRVIERAHGGVVEALNAGLQAATGELVVQLDADASIETRGWLEAMVSFFVSDERIGAVTAKVVLDSGEIHACGVEVVGPDGLHDGGTTITEPPGARTYHQRVARPTEGRSRPLEGRSVRCERIAEVDGGMGCCMMYRRDVALEVGGYDPGYAPVWFDDLDLTLAIRRHGLKVFFTPEVRVVHHVQGRSAGQSVSIRRRVAAGVRALARVALPRGPRARLIRALELDRTPREHTDRLAHHYAYWRDKWGFDMLNPDMHAVRERWGDTEICWRTVAQRRAAGEAIVAAYEARRAAAGAHPSTVGVPIISTNEGELLRHALPAALAQDDVEVVVIDNASDDSTAAVAEELGVRCVRLHERHSFGRAMNMAVRSVDTEAVLFVQPDCFLSPGLVAAARAHLDDPAVGSVAPKLIRTEGPGAEQRLDAMDTAGMSLDRRRKNGLVGHGRPALAYDTVAEAFGADGAVALYRRAALQDAAVDGQVFDEDLVMLRDGVPADWASDADLAWRVRLLGWRCVYEPSAVAHHIRRYSPSTRGRVPEWQRMVQFRNRYLMMAKNDPLESLARDLPRILLYEVLALGYALLRERFLLRGYVEAARVMPRILGKRRDLQRRRRERAAPAPPYGLEPPA